MGYHRLLRKVKITFVIQREGAREGNLLTLQMENWF